MTRPAPAGTGRYGGPGGRRDRRRPAGTWPRRVGAGRPGAARLGAWCASELMSIRTTRWPHAAERGAEVVQFFLGDPQGWKGPVLPADGRRDPGVRRRRLHPRALRDQRGDGQQPHPHPQPQAARRAPRGRGRARRQGPDRARRARRQGRRPAGRVRQLAQGVRAHGVPESRCSSRTPRAAATRWPAGSTASPGCGTRSTASTWASASTPATRTRAARTCADVVERVKAITGRIDLIHCNDSRDAFGSGADRHANLGEGQIDPELIVAVCRAAGAPIVVETPGRRPGRGHRVPPRAAGLTRRAARPAVALAIHKSTACG